MPAMLEDPSTPAVYRQSGDLPYPTPFSPLPAEIMPRQVTLRDRVTTATLIPFSSPDQVPVSLLAYLNDQLNREIEKGDTYPMTETIPLANFGSYWFSNFGAVMLLGHIENVEQIKETGIGERDWEKECLGSFLIKPNYPGRSSHVCNGSFLVTDGARNRGVGRLMGECYLEWAPKLGYTYSVFNLVYETNVVSCRIWDALGFKRIGRVKGCARLASYPDQLVDAIIYGRELGQDEDVVSEERFDKIRYYLKHGKYPNGADRAEKSRLRSAATHYKLIAADSDGQEKLMLKGKEVIADAPRQYEIARNIHIRHHGGINKTTAAIADKYHWVRIKETVSAVIKNCPECSDPIKAPTFVVESSRRTNGTPSQKTTGLAGTDGKVLSGTPRTPQQRKGPGRPGSSASATSATPRNGERAAPVAIMARPAEPLLNLSHVPVPPPVLSPLISAHNQAVVEKSQIPYESDLPVDPRIMDGIAHSAYSHFTQNVADAADGSNSEPDDPAASQLQEEQRAALLLRTPASEDQDIVMGGVKS